MLTKAQTFARPLSGTGMPSTGVKLIDALLPTGVAAMAVYTAAGFLDIDKKKAWKLAALYGGGVLLTNLFFTYLFDAPTAAHAAAKGL